MYLVRVNKQKCTSLLEMYVHVLLYIVYMSSEAYIHVNSSVAPPDSCLYHV